MGDPKKSRKKYSRPLHPWRAERIEKEKAVERIFGLKNKKEIWKAQSYLKKCRSLAREQSALVRAGNKQAEKESSQLLKKLVAQGVLKEGCKLHDILALEVEDMLGRRLETLVYEKGMAHTMKQSRQLIVHGHIAIGGKKVTVPSYFVLVDEEPLITYASTSPLASEGHIMRPGGNIFELRKQKEEKEKMKRDAMAQNRGRRPRRK